MHDRMHMCLFRRLGIVAIVLAAATFATAAHAQRGTARLEGTATDSLRARPLAGAMVLVTRNAPEPAAWFSAVTDERGRYTLDTLPAGQYDVGFWHPILDSLDFALPGRKIELGEGQRVRVDFALPSVATLLAVACPGVPLPPGTGVLLGGVRDADADRPLAGAVVAIRWSDLTVDRTTLQLSEQEHAQGVPTDADGLFRLCGLPTESWLLVQVQHAGRTGIVLRESIPDTMRLRMLNISFSEEGARTFAAADSVAKNGWASLPPLTGSASVSGTVLGETGQPLAGVQLRVLETATTARTDSTGRYLLSGLPAGTQLLEAKRIGYRIVQQPVPLVRGQEVEMAIRLQRIVSLDSIRVVAQRSRYREFERNRKSAFGRFLTDEDIARRHAFQVTDLLRTMPGFRVEGGGFDARVVSSRGTTSLTGRSCDVNIVIDNMQHQDINWVQPSDIGAMEVYAGPAGAPGRYDSQCGVIVIWTKR